MNEPLDWVSRSHWLIYYEGNPNEFRTMSINEFMETVGLEDAGLTMTVRWPDKQ